MRKPRKTNADRAHEDFADYDVGYGRPPVHSRFKAGQSGNPKGRPKGRKKMGALLQDALNERISIREGDVIRKVSRAEAAVLALLSKAMKGDAKAFSTLLAFAQQSGEFEKEPQPMEYFRRIIIRPEDFGVFPGGKRCPPEELTTTVLQDQESVQQPKSNSRK